MHSRPPTIPKYRARFVIAAYEGLRINWLYFITEGLKDAIGDLVGGKKPWAAIAQWLIVLVPLVLPIKNKEEGSLGDDTEEGNQTPAAPGEVDPRMDP